jgi:hypothetical protein
MFDVIIVSFSICFRGPSINATKTLSNEGDRENAIRVFHWNKQATVGILQHV